MLILMFSLAGVPPTVGFVAKLSVLKATVAAGHVWLAVLAVLTSLVAAFYYLRVVKTMYFDPVPEVNATNPGGGLDARVLLGINGGLALLLGLMPQPLMSACVQAVSRALAG